MKRERERERREATEWVNCVSLPKRMRRGVSVIISSGTKRGHFSFRKVDTRRVALLSDFLGKWRTDVVNPPEEGYMSEILLPLFRSHHQPPATFLHKSSITSCRWIKGLTHNFLTCSLILISPPPSLSHSFLYTALLPELWPPNRLSSFITPLLLSTIILFLFILNFLYFTNIFRIVGTQNNALVYDCMMRRDS
jgi:hypothetical protein